MLDDVTEQGTYTPPGPGDAPHGYTPYPCHFEGCTHVVSAPTPREVLAQRLVGGALMLVLMGFTALLWGIDGGFRILFTAYTVWAGFWLWALFVKRPSI